MKKIVVAGDLILDYNLVRYPTTPARHHILPPSMVLRKRMGGAWFLEDIIRLACDDLRTREGLDFHIYAPPRQNVSDGDVNQAYQIWELHRKSSEQAKEEVWRISQFLGCEPTSAMAPSFLPGDDVAEPDILVLDDLCLGFRDQNAVWPAALKEDGKPGHIVLKTSAAPAPKNPLWSTLLERGRSDRLTVVLPVSALRARGAAISRALSWDRTIEELVTEFEEGVSRQDLGRCLRIIVLLGSAGIASFSRGHPNFGPSSGPAVITLDEFAKFERFVYDPEQHEGTWRAKRPGRTFGAMSMVTAAMVRHVLQPQDYPLFIALSRALVALRVSHDLGAGVEGEFDPDGANPKIGSAFHSVEGKTPSTTFCAAYPRFSPDFPYGFTGILGAGQGYRSDLLGDLTGAGSEYVAAKATEVVLLGPNVALRQAPKARYAHLLTVNREEIERINAIHALILGYRDNPQERKPLSIAVFGTSGSGKSFAIKQLLSTIFEGQKPLEFNLSQFRSVDDLGEAFHQVRDQSIRGQIPLVFWDEFDTDNLNWLKAFLAPMQDGEFRAGSILHPLGRSIFVFAGATSPSFEAFNRSVEGREETPGEERFRMQKGPDFVSRLQGFVNIKGANLLSCPEKTVSTEGEPNASHLIRRAILLRASLEKHYPQLIDAKTGTASISTSVVQAFLRVKTFHHGARSLDSLVGMSSPENSYLGVSSLPSQDLLRLHVTEDFLDHLQEGRIDLPVVELLAEACHSAWRKQKEVDGWKYGDIRDDRNKKHPLLVAYGQLEDQDKEANRRSARLTQAKLRAVGFEIARGDRAEQELLEINKRMIAPDREKLMRVEHDIWLRDHLLDGYEWAEHSNDALRLHRDIALFEHVPVDDQVLDRAIIDSIPTTLAKNGYVLERRCKPSAQ